ncbi:MAG: tripartite tricarboxylate transporter TctB family protein [Acidobacteria bacterium]|nr:tripartite tricarboxylate transporter TctB family protein [Acidobacteriota bacterium]
MRGRGRPGQHDRWVAGFLLLVGLLSAFEARGLTVGELGRPGPGFFPFYLAVALSIVSVALLVRSFHHAGLEGTAAQGSGEQSGGNKIIWTLLALFGYTFALDHLGFLVATFLLMLILFRVVELRRWPAAVAGSLATSLLAYGLFKLLQIRLPPGIWGP